MNTRTKFITCGTSALFAAALALQAQTGAGSSGSATTPTTGGSTSGGFNSSAGQATTPPTSSSTASTYGGSGSMQSSSPASSSSASTDTPNTSGSYAPSSSGTFGSAGTGTATGSMSASGSMSNSSSYNGTSGINSATQSTSPSFGATQSTNTTGSASGQFGTTGSQFGTTTQASAGGTVAVDDSQVSTVIQQLDTQGPAIVQRVSTAVGDLACTPETTQNLVDALRTGNPVTITSDVNGQPESATFNPSGQHLGYGEAYIALALAAQELRQAGVTSCATPQQWQSALLGGPLSTTTSSTTVASSVTPTQLPGILTLRSQGQGWGQIAQEANVQLGQIVSNSGVAMNSNANSNTNLNNENSNAAGAPTGYPSSQMNQGRPAGTESTSTGSTNATESTPRQPDMSNQNGSQNSSSTHADTSGQNNGTTP